LTKILLGDGFHSKLAKKIDIGDSVLGYNVSSGTTLPVTVIDIESTIVSSLLTIIHDYGSITLTPLNQPVWMRNGTYIGWLRDPIDLLLGDEIFHVPSNSWVYVNYLFEYSGSFEVYDIITDPLNVFIGNGILLDQKIP
jgi:hypothetical protein